MPEHFTKVGQAAGSMDCGFFAGYVLNDWEFHGPPGLLEMKMSQEDVYRARNEYRSWLGGGKFDPDRMSLEPDTTSPGLSPAKTMLDYLLVLRCFSYKLDAGRTNDAIAIRDKLRRYLPNVPDYVGVLLSIHRPAMAHWITVLCRQTPSSNGNSQGGQLQRPTVTWGASTESVRLVQETLNSITPTLLSRLGEDGVFGQKSCTRVKEFQENAGGLQVDGIVGPNSWYRLEPYIGDSGAGNPSVTTAPGAPSTSSESVYSIYDSGRSSAPYGVDVTESVLIDWLSQTGVNCFVWKHG